MLIAGSGPLVTRKHSFEASHLCPWACRQPSPDLSNKNQYVPDHVGTHNELNIPSNLITVFNRLQCLLTNCSRRLFAVRCAPMTYRISLQSPLCSHNLVSIVLCRGLAAVTVDIASHFESHIFVSEARSTMFRLPAAITLPFFFST